MRKPQRYFFEVVSTSPGVALLRHLPKPEQAKIDPDIILRKGLDKIKQGDVVWVED